ncbi:MAG TPA: hypothetical protein DEF12_06195 [Rhodobacteraceae bacterium]|nr:hypothetical protein [Paracoccaceae bacterium]
MTALRSFVFALLLMPFLSVMGQAQQAPLRPLFDALRMSEMIAVMREEGLAHGMTLGAEMLPSDSSSEWRALLERLYDPTRMAAVVEAEFDQSFGSTDGAPLLAFFASDLGQLILGLELNARRAFLTDGAEEAARAHYRQEELAALTEANAKFEAISAYVRANDLVEMNVSGGLTASLRFYQGLAEGGALTMTEAEMVQDVWAGEEETRSDTKEWVHAFLGLAYRDLTTEEVAQYTALSETKAGKALNAALFAGFDQMYGEHSYSLGLALANKMRGETL